MKEHDTKNGVEIELDDKLQSVKWRRKENGGNEDEGVKWREIAVSKEKNQKKLERVTLEPAQDRCERGGTHWCAPEGEGLNALCP